MFSGKTSAGEIAGVVIVVAVFLILGIFVCGCGPLPEPSEIGAARWRAHKARAEARMAERRQRRENQLPLHRTPSQTRNRAIMFADEKPQDPTPVQVPLPSPPPPTVTRNRSPTPQMAVRSSESDSSSINSRNPSSWDARSPRGNEQITKDANHSVENAHSSSTSISGKDIVPPGISVPSPVYSDSGAKN